MLRADRRARAVVVAAVALYGFISVRYLDSLLGGSINRSATTFFVAIWVATLVFIGAAAAQHLAVRNRRQEAPGGRFALVASLVTSTALLYVIGGS